MTPAFILFVTHLEAKEREYVTTLRQLSVLNRS
jgi:hypothetical protein